MLTAICQQISLISIMLNIFWLYTNIVLDGKQVFLARLFFDRSLIPPPPFCISAPEGRRDFSDTAKYLQTWHIYLTVMKQQGA